MFKLLKHLKSRLSRIRSRRQKLAQLELKLRSMRSIATKVRDQNPEDQQLKKLNQRFEKLKIETQALQEQLDN